MSSLKHSPVYAPSYSSLGVYYADISHDEDRAAKCFHKAFELDATASEAARRLAMTFANSQDWELAEVIASRNVEAVRKRNVPGKEASWPFRVLGVVYLVCYNLYISVNRLKVNTI